MQTLLGYIGEEIVVVLSKIDSSEAVTGILEEVQLPDQIKVDGRNIPFKGREEAIRLVYRASDRMILFQAIGVPIRLPPRDALSR
jgi:hypothetical protein